MEILDFEAIADQLQIKYIQGSSISRCDILSFDMEQKTIKFIEETQWWKLTSKGDIDIAAMEKEKVELIKKMSGTMFLFGLYAMETNKDMLAFKKIFEIATMIDEEFRAGKAIDYLKEELNDYRDGLFSAIEISYS